MYTYQTGLAAEKHDEFVKQHPQVNLLQSSKWAQIKDNWGNERIGFYKDGQLVGVASILIKQLPLGFSMLYIPRGPVIDYGNQELVNFVLASIKRYGKSKRALFAKFDPALLLRQYKFNEADTTEENVEIIHDIEVITKAGAIWTGRTTEIAESIQPRFQANIYTEKEITSTFPKHTKRLMKDALNRGVITTRGGLEDVDSFAQVVALTESRKGVALRNKDYFQKMMTIYGDDAYLHLAKVNLTERLAQYKAQLAEIEADLAETAENQKKRFTRLTQQQASIQKYITEFEDYVQQYPDELLVAGILSIRFGNVMEMLYAGMNDQFKKFYPQYSLYPKVFEDAYADGIIWANMGGVEGSLDDGLTKFKSNFNPTFEEFIGEFTLPINPLLYKLSQIAYDIRKKRNKHH